MNIENRYVQKILSMISSKNNTHHGILEINSQQCLSHNDFGFFFLHLSVCLGYLKYESDRPTAKSRHSFSVFEVGFSGEINRNENQSVTRLHVLSYKGGSQHLNIHKIT